MDLYHCDRFVDSNFIHDSLWRSELSKYFHIRLFGYYDCFNWCLKFSIWKSFEKNIFHDSALRYIFHQHNHLRQSPVFHIRNRRKKNPTSIDTIDKFIEFNPPTILKSFTKNEFSYEAQFFNTNFEFIMSIFFVSGRNLDRRQRLKVHIRKA